MLCLYLSMNVTSIWVCVCDPMLWICCDNKDSELCLTNIIMTTAWLCPTLKANWNQLGWHSLLCNIISAMVACIVTTRFMLLHLRPYKLCSNWQTVVLSFHWSHCASFYTFLPLLLDAFCNLVVHRNFCDDFTFARLFKSKHRLQSIQIPLYKIYTYIQRQLGLKMLCHQCGVF